MIVHMEPKKPGRPKDPASKRSQGGDRHTHPRKAFHLQAPLLEAFERYLKSVKPVPSEAECLRVALEEFLEKRGFWPTEESQ